jgi:hypothetical protein
MRDAGGRFTACSISLRKRRRMSSSLAPPRPVVANDSLMALLYSGPDNPPTDKIIKVFIRRLHAALDPAPHSIMMAGLYQTKPPLPFSPGLETAGVIAVCGREASGFKPGDRVMAILQYGGLAEFAATPAKAFFLPAMLQPAAPDLFRRHFVTGEVS